MPFIDKQESFYGTTTVGERGQVVIPSQARTDLGLNTGEKLLVFKMGEDILVMAKTSQLEKFAAHLTKKLASMQEIIRENAEN